MEKRLVWRILDNLEEGVTFFFLAVMCVFVFLQLFFRFVINRPLLYPEEIARGAYVWVCFIGVSLATKSREHIRVDFFVERLPLRLRRWVVVVVDCLSCLALAMLGWFGVQFVIFSRPNITPALEVPLNLQWVSFPIGFFLAAIRLLRLLVSDIRQLRAGGPAGLPAGGPSGAQG